MTNNDLKVYCIYHTDSQIFEYNLDNIPEYIELFNVNNLDMNGDNINYLNPYLCELCVYYYIWKNQIYSKYVGFCHYRRFYKKINFENLEKYGVHYYGFLSCSINHFIKNKTFYSKEINDNLYNYLKSINIFNENILNDYLYGDKKLNIPWKLSYIFEWNLFNKFCEIVFGFLEYMLPNYKDINNYNSRFFAWKFEYICGIILCLLTNNICLSNTNWQIYFNKILLTKSNDINKIKLWERKNNRTCANLYVISEKLYNEKIDIENVNSIQNINEIPNYNEKIELDINQYIKCKEPNDFNTNNYTIENITNSFNNLLSINDINKIFFICLVNDKDRVNNVNTIISNINDQFSDKIKINYISQINLYEDINIVKDLNKYFPNVNSNNKNYNTHVINSFSCFLNHFNIISEAYFLNYNYILTFEDDAYINNFNKFKEILNNIPNNADIIQFYNNSISECTLDDNFKNDYFYKVIKLKTYSTACMLLSNKAITYIYNFYKNNKAVYADLYQYTLQDFLNECNIYIVKDKIVNTFKFKSKITY